ncbi:hypothetical protein INT43_000517 [Umbelopsis isabellina]|uniref:Uncharacterized protein n=1 Tax=Mortierella isabellina TaxID=91625 RepID=A0A8H7Q2A4_MORIS|nr:hypothetical protein INT43_000517 [Umbelopsis isabellina]
MDIEDLRRRFELACELYRIPARMFTHGLQQLETIFDLPATTNRNLFMRPQTGCHIIVRPYSCFRMVYLLFKGEGLAYNERNNSIIIPSTAEVYAGQTMNFHTENPLAGEECETQMLYCVWATTSPCIKGTAWKL